MPYKGGTCCALSNEQFSTHGFLDICPSFFNNRMTNQIAKCLEVICLLIEKEKVKNQRSALMQMVKI